MAHLLVDLMFQSGWYDTNTVLSTKIFEGWKGYISVFQGIMGELVGFQDLRLNRISLYL
uniref:Uncharacterized protein n=1 Tax=Meloidogyne incognita TaxID=6306 RepID=A0A914KUX1_MELIC